MSETPAVKKPTAAWYLMPIFLGWLGGLIMYLVLKDENKSMAKNGLIIGIVLTIPSVIIGVFWASTMASMGF